MKHFFRQVFSFVTLLLLIPRPLRAAGSIENAPPLTKILFNILQFVLSIAGVVGIIGVVVSGLWYLTASGDEERMRTAKRMAVACVIGTGIVLGALLFVVQVSAWFS